MCAEWGGGRAGLDFVADEEGVVAVQQLLRAREVAVVRHDDARLALDGLHHVGHDVGVRVERGLERGDVVVGYHLEACMRAQTTVLACAALGGVRAVGGVRSEAERNAGAR